MSSVQNLRELINQRLTAAAEEIFTEFEKTIVQYEEEIDRQRRLLENIWKPQITQHTAELPQQQTCKEEEVPTEQNVCIQERNSSVDQENPETLQIKEEQEELPTNLDQEDAEPPQMREEEEELCNSLDRQQSGQTAAADMNQKADSFMLVQCKSKCEELPREKFSVSENTIGQYEEEIHRQRRLLDNIWKPQITQHTTELPQQQICKEEEVPTEQNVCIQERNSSVDQENPETLQIKEEQEELPTNLDQEDTEPPQMREEEEELCNSLDRQQSGQTAAADMNQKADSFMLVQCKSKCEELSREKFSVSEKTIGHYEKEINRQRRLFNITQNLQIKLHRIDLQQQHIYQEQKVFTDHLYCKRERNFPLDLKDLQFKEAQEKLCISLDQGRPTTCAGER
ncbi:transcription factor SPT20 homolog isoform X2 [Amphiprion ocellaris]|uniref:transcription factor SPT20 homolog isoform X2 n=1 Tax=Amphiprion ocellaris TaxID=80972 RepID=UPI002411511B|nr:transcription factor SPT20 homolog isoform X2 [Amphiprion ocellaris]